MAHIILKTAVSQRGTETSEAADKELYLRKTLKNCYPLGEDKAPENRPPFDLLCHSAPPWQFQRPDLVRIIGSSP